MRGTAVGILGGLIVAITILSVSADQRDLRAPYRTSTPAGLTAGQHFAGQQLIALDGGSVEGQQLVVLIDQSRQTMGSYLVDRQTGQITLRCVRNCRWDLQMDEFNGGEPSPDKIQALLRTH